MISFKQFLLEEMNTGGFNDIINQSPYRNSGMKDDRIVRRKYQIFDVDTLSYMKARNAKKFGKRYDDIFTDKNIKEYAKKNPKHPVIIRHAPSGEMIFLRNGFYTNQTLKNYKK